MKYGIPGTAKEVFIMLQRIYWGIFIGMLLFPVIIYALSRIITPGIIGKTVINNLFIFSLFLSSVCLTSAELFYRKRITQTKQPGSSLLEKLQRYKNALVVYLAFNEVPAVISTLFYMLTGEYLFIIITGIILINMLFKRPDKSRIFNELELNTKEQIELN